MRRARLGAVSPTRRRPLARFVIFSAACLAAWIAPGPLLGAASPWAYGAAVLALLLAVTWIALWSEGQPMAALGLAFDSRRVREFACGFAITSVLFAAAALGRAAWIGAAWQFDGRASIVGALGGLPAAFLLMAGEEFVFRGYGFRQLIAAVGTRTALFISAVAFGVYHLAQTGFGMWGIGAFWVVALPALGGLVFSLAFIRTGGMAMPLGLHLGGNWIQASVLRLGEAPHGAPAALFTAPLTTAQAYELWSPDLLPQVPYLCVVVTTAVLLRVYSARSASIGSTRVARRAGR